MALKDDLESNYSRVGTVLIERLYDSEDFLSLSGVESTDVMARHAGVNASSNVLDIGAGLGGPALHMVETLGCKVTAVDLVQTNVDQAQARAKARGLDSKASFHQADAQALPFTDGAFDVVFSQDAFCHVPNKQQVINEATRLARSGGKITFIDWVESGSMSAQMQQSVYSALAAENLATAAQYKGWLAQNGCAVTVEDDISSVFASRYQSAMERLRGMEDEISKQFSPRVFGIMVEKNAAIQDAFDSGDLGGVLIVADRP
jgi:sarcosine/dimethylglycine N-methyltransferase